MNTNITDSTANRSTGTSAITSWLLVLFMVFGAVVTSSHFHTDNGHHHTIAHEDIEPCSYKNHSHDEHGHASEHDCSICLLVDLSQGTIDLYCAPHNTQAQAIYLLASLEHPHLLTTTFAFARAPPQFS